MRDMARSRMGNMEKGKSSVSRDALGDPVGEQLLCSDWWFFGPLSVTQDMARTVAAFLKEDIPHVCFS